jgi:4-hydroxybenzoate polyprenyltransferase
MMAHILISGLAILIAGFVSFRLGLGQYSIIYIAAAFGLWFYSTDFKKQLFTGNLLVALFVAMVPFTVGLYELHLSAKTYSILTLPPFEVNFRFIFNFIAGFSALAFLINLVREIIKDIEDTEGDRLYGCRTIPIVMGLETAKNCVSFLILLIILIIGWIQKDQYDSGAKNSFLYLLLFIQLPLVVLVFLVQKGVAAKDFKRPDRLSKLIMLAGLLYSLVIYYSFMGNA